MRDLYNNIGAELALAPSVKSAAADGIAIDTKGFRSLAFVVNTGAIVSAGDFGIVVQESDTTTSGDFTDADASVVDSNAPATLAANSSYRLGYRGFKRYVRVSLTKAGGTSIAAGASAVLGHPIEAPVAD
ncbi:hypothetical protein OF122_11275 [Pelagibacterium flavum]|uniref:Uncharacterized protein n=1 Tax=Pelagibacterium flavum TaxID=2984530 RepID=A0ABY6ILN6_9HYPH|nr:hypothetical protein [Pelagibacterium sp. YIM 151497]UYQ70655.1 hypothetical protein OF122_11275 [Pelagibacterium sp. YIM 151497]